MEEIETVSSDQEESKSRQVPVKLIQHHPQWEIIAYLRFHNIPHRLCEVGIEFALGMPTPVIVDQNSLYSGASCLPHLYLEVDHSQEVVDLRNYLQYHLMEPMRILMIRHNAYQPDRWFGTSWIMSYYQEFRNHFTLVRYLPTYPTRLFHSIVAPLGP
jgi:hypothetical protein